MKTMKIVTIVCWIISALVLIGLILWFLTGSIFGAWTGGWGNWTFGNRIGGWENLTGPFETDGVYNVATAGVDSLKIDWVAGEVTVKSHEGNDIQITELAQRTLRDNEKLKYGVAGNTLEIKFRESGIGSASMPQKRLEVLVPYELSQNLQTISVDSVSGGIIITDMVASSLNSSTTSGNINATGNYNYTDLNSVSGSITLNNQALGSTADIDTISGSMDLQGAFGKVLANTVSGGISVISTQVPSSFKADSISGSIDITLPGDAGIAVNHTSVSGRLQSDLPITTGGKGAQFEISTVSGTTTIKALW